MVRWYLILACGIAQVSAPSQATGPAASIGQRGSETEGACLKQVTGSGKSGAAYNEQREQ